MHGCALTRTRERHPCVALRALRFVSHALVADEHRGMHGHTRPLACGHACMAHTAHACTHARVRPRVGTCTCTCTCTGTHVCTSTSTRPDTRARAHTHTHTCTHVHTHTHTHTSAQACLACGRIAAALAVSPPLVSPGTLRAGSVIRFAGVGLFFLRGDSHG